MDARQACAFTLQHVGNVAARHLLSWNEPLLQIKLQQRRS
jgi:hypothetical protein